MNLTDDEILKFQRGTPIFIKDICAVFPATVGEIVDLGYSTFHQYLNVLTASKPNSGFNNDEQVKELFEKLSDFQYLLLMVSLDANINQLVKRAFKFFTHEETTFSIESAYIVFGPISEKHLLFEDDFYDFQKILRRMYFLEQEGEEIIIYNDDSPAVKRLKMQMRENREKVRKAKAKQAMQSGSDLKFSDLIGSLTINHCNLNISNIWDITYYALHDQLKRMGWRDQFSINNQAALAGAKLNKNQLKHWMRSISSSEKS